MQRKELIQGLGQRIIAVKKSHPLRVAIDGAGCSGKSILSVEIGHFLVEKGVKVFSASIDSFHNPLALRSQKGSYSPEGYYEDSFDLDMILQKVLIPLGPGGNRFYTPGHYNFRIEKETDPSRCRASKESVLLFDGIFLQQPRLIPHFDLVIHIDVDLNLTLKRSLSRDLGYFKKTDKITRKYKERYIPGYKLYQSQRLPKLRSNLCFNNDQPEKPYWLKF